MSIDLGETFAELSKESFIFMEGASYMLPVKKDEPLSALRVLKVTKNFISYTFVANVFQPKGTYGVSKVSKKNFQKLLKEV